MIKNIKETAFEAGTLTLVLRWVIGWTYFSAFWRRIVLENKLNPEEAGYIGEKFNHFLPNALGIKPIIEYLVTHPETLWYAMVIFTIIEALVGLMIILGLFTRLMAFGVFNLALGILLGSGWLGTTCLDEWQIGVLGIASGFVLMLTGSGKYSIDYYLLKKKHPLTQKQSFPYIGSGILPWATKTKNKIILTGSICITLLTLFTNQYFHGGVFGTLHNKSVKPKLEISNVYTREGYLNFTVMRVEGADVYGSFLIEIAAYNENNEKIEEWSMQELRTLKPHQIQNFYVAKIVPHKNSLLLPLGAKASISLPITTQENIARIQLTDISGLEWSSLIE